jgi:hypothetical protein
MTTVKKFRLLDKGAVLELVFKESGVVVDISAATKKQIKLRKPNGDTLTKDGSLATDGKDGKLWYTIESGVLDVAGWWKSEGYVEFSDGKNLSTTVVGFEVEQTL